MKRDNVLLPLVVTLGIQAMVSMVAVTIPVLAPSAAPDIGISATSVGIYVSLMYIGSMVSSLWSADFIHRYGALRVSQICLLLCGIGLMLVATKSFPAIIASAFIIGFGYGPVTPASSHILTKNTPAAMMSFIFSVKQTGVPLGGVLAGAIVPILVVTIGWQNAAVIVATCSILLMIVIAPIRSELDRDRQAERAISFKGVSKPLKMVLAHRELLRLAIISFLYAGMQLCLFTFLVIYLTKDIGMSFVAAGFTLSAAQMSGTIGRIIWGILADRYIRPRFLLGILGIGMAAGSVATALIKPDWPSHYIVWTMIFFGATAIGWNGVYLAEAARLAPKGQAGTATGGTLFFTFLGVVLGPPIFAAVASATNSYPMGFLFFAGLTFLCGAATIINRSK